MPIAVETVRETEIALPSQRDSILSSPHSITVVEALIANLLNPKAIIFYLTVVSRFSGQHGWVGSYLILASAHVVVMSLWLVIVSHILIFSAKGRDPLLLGLRPPQMNGIEQRQAYERAVQHQKTLELEQPKQKVWRGPSMGR